MSLRSCGLHQTPISCNCAACSAAMNTTASVVMPAEMTVLSAASCGTSPLFHKSRITTDTMELFAPGAGWRWRDRGSHA